MRSATSQDPKSTPRLTLRTLDPLAKPLLKVADVAAILDTSESSVRKMIANAQLPIVYVGGLKSTRVRTADLLDYLRVVPQSLKRPLVLDLDSVRRLRATRHPSTDDPKSA